MSSFMPSYSRYNYSYTITAAIIVSLITYIIAKIPAYFILDLYIHYKIDTFYHNIINPILFFKLHSAAMFSWLPVNMRPEYINDANLWFQGFKVANHGINYAIYLYVPMAISILTGLYVGKKTFAKIKNEYVIEGMELEQDPKLALKHLRNTLKPKVKKSGQGVMIHPGMKGDFSDAVYLPIPSESRHFIYIGASGCGKTQSLQYLMKSAIQRGDKCVIFDFKSDFTATIPAWMPKGKKPVLIAPWDRRSKRWDIAKDIKFFTDVEAIAEILIQQSSGGDDYWVEGPRDIMAAVLTALKSEIPNFTVHDLAAILSDLTLIKQCVADYRPAAISHISGEGGQTQGVLGSIRASSKMLDSWARLTNPNDDKKGFSFVDFAHGLYKKNNVVIISGHLKMPFHYPVCAAMISTLISEVLTMPDSKTRKMWVFIDEANRLSRISILEAGLTAGRSKGLKLVIAFQDVGKFQQVYGEELANTIIGQCGTKIIGKCRGEVAKWAEDQSGNQVVERLSSTMQAGGQQASDLDGALGLASNASTTWQREMRPVVMNGLFGALPDPNSIGGPMLFCQFDGVDDKIMKLFFPYKSLPEVAKNIIYKAEVRNTGKAKNSYLDMLQASSTPSGHDKKTNTDATTITTIKNNYIDETAIDEPVIILTPVEVDDDILNALDDMNNETTSKDSATTSKDSADEALSETIDAAIEASIGTGSSAVDHFADMADLIEESMSKKPINSTVSNGNSRKKKDISKSKSRSKDKSKGSK